MPERAVYFLPGVRFADYWIAFREEIEIEEEALSARARQDEFSRRIALEAAEALRNLDALTVAGCYENERERLRSVIESHPGYKPPPHPIPAGQMAEAERRWEKAANYIAGKQSPDAAQRQRFNRLDAHQGMGSKSLFEAEAVLDVLETAKRRKGRKRMRPPWHKWAAAMSAIRMDVHAGRSIPAAAARVPMPPGGTPESQAKRLERLYRQKLKLRDNN